MQGTEGLTRTNRLVGKEQHAAATDRREPPDLRERHSGAAERLARRQRRVPLRGPERRRQPAIRLRLPQRLRQAHVPCPARVGEAGGRLARPLRVPGRRVSGASHRVEEGRLDR